MRKENLNVNHSGEIDHTYQCNEVGDIDWGYMSFTRTARIEQGCVSVDSRHYSVREKSSVCKVPRTERTKESWTKEENRNLWECYLRNKQKKRDY